MKSIYMQILSVTRLGQACQTRTPSPVAPFDIFWGPSQLSNYIHEMRPQFFQSE
jgi:hypothetical protein